ncbi:MAG: hypothetical protein PUJ41_07725, partial [Bacteroidales bacterium]|nr:hypothetical protein [Bacteroidales bacterium]MDY4141203.1 hypothetical protein [Sodaliphilus sp.]
EWNQKQKHKKQPWSNVECFAFGGATVRFAALETSFPCRQPHNPSATLLRGRWHRQKDKNRSPSAKNQTR